MVEVATTRASSPTYAPPITALRWGTVAVGLALASLGGLPDARPTQLAWGLALAAYATYRSGRPLAPGGGATVVPLVAEIALCGVAVLWTGRWASPYAFTLVVPVIVASFGRGAATGLALTCAAASIISIAEVVTTDLDRTTTFLSSAQWSVELLLVALVAGYARRFTGEAARQQSMYVDRLGRLSEANSLLFSLHRLAQSLPALLDLEEVLDSTMARLRDLFDPDRALILLTDDDGGYSTVRQLGLALPGIMNEDALPGVLARARVARAPVFEPNLGDGSAVGVEGDAGSGLYAALRCRGELVGIVGLESDRPERFESWDIELLNGLVDPAALAIDNGRWFSRLRTMGAAEERTRIARDLHDRIGQSLAFVGFELDRAAKLAVTSPEVVAVLDELRTAVRSVTAEVRDTLFDLRTDVAEDRALDLTLGEYVARVGQRSSMATTYEPEVSSRLPLPQERELWRIAQEAVSNVVRHADASSLVVRFYCDERRARLEVTDDGAGFAGRAGRPDSYGMLGMRERADAIGARLVVESTPGTGTTVRCSLVRT